MKYKNKYLWVDLLHTKIQQILIQIVLLGNYQYFNFSLLHIGQLRYKFIIFLGLLCIFYIFFIHKNWINMRKNNKKLNSSQLNFCFSSPKVPRKSFLKFDQSVIRTSERHNMSFFGEKNCKMESHLDYYFIFS